MSPGTTRSPRASTTSSPGAGVGRSPSAVTRRSRMRTSRTAWSPCAGSMTVPPRISMRRRPRARGAGGRPRSDLEVRGLDALDPGAEHVLPRLGQRAAGVDAARGILDDESGEAGLARVERRPRDAEVRREAGQEDLLQAALAEIADEPRRRLAVGLEERRVGVHRLPVALPDDQLGVGDPEILVEVGVRGALDAVIRPEHLR